MRVIPGCGRRISRTGWRSTGMWRSGLAIEGRLNRKARELANGTWQRMRLRRGRARLQAMELVGNLIETLAEMLLFGMSGQELLQPRFGRQVALDQLIDALLICRGRVDYEQFKIAMN